MIFGKWVYIGKLQIKFTFHKNWPIFDWIRKHYNFTTENHFGVTKIESLCGDFQPLFTLDLEKSIILQLKTISPVGDFALPAMPTLVSSIINYVSYKFVVSCLSTTVLIRHLRENKQSKLLLYSLWTSVQYYLHNLNLQFEISLAMYMMKIIYLYTLLHSDISYTVPVYMMGVIHIMVKYKPQVYLILCSFNHCRPSHFCHWPYSPT